MKPDWEGPPNEDRKCDKQTENVKTDNQAGSDVSYLPLSYLPLLIGISDDFDIQNDLIMDEPPPKASAVRGKKQWQMSDLPNGMNNNEAWHKMLILTVYWHFGNQRDVWIYEDDELVSNLRRSLPCTLKSTVFELLHPSANPFWDFN